MKLILKTGSSESRFSPRQRLWSATFLVALAVWLAIVSACGGGSVPAPVISSFTAVKNSITSGNSTTLNWSVSNAASLAINGTTVTGTSYPVSPTTTTTYTLTATNTVGKSVTAQVTVTVVGAPSIASFTAASNAITAGNSTTLNWTASNATSFSLDGTTVSGTSYPVSPMATTTYTLTATNSLGASVTAQTTVHVLPGISAFTSSASSVSVGGSGATLSWSVLDANSLSLAATPTGGSTTMTDVTGTTSLYVNPTVATSYVLTASNSEGNSNSPTVQITTTPALTDITSFLASPTASTGGSPVVAVTLTPVFVGGDTATITDDQGNTVKSPATSGTGVSVTPSKTTTYTLTVNNSSTTPPGTEVRKLRVVVGDITDFSGVGNPEYGNFYQFLPGSATTAQFYVPYSLTADPTGNVYFTDAQACVLAKLDTSGNATIVAGIANNCGSADGDALTMAQFGAYLSGVALTSSGEIYVGDGANNEIRMISGGQVSTPAGSPTNTTDMDGTGSNAGFAALSIVDAALDSVGELIVAENGAIRVMDSSGTVTTLAGVSGSTSLTDGTGRTGNGTNTARFIYVAGMAIDTSTDTIYLTDDNTVRTMTPDKSTGSGAATWTWTITTWVNPSDTQGDLDGPASTAQLYFPGGIARASDGTLFVADYGNYIRRITPAGVVDTIAGSPTSCVPSSTAMCTLPNTSNTTAEPLPGLTYAPYRIAVDPTSNQLFFDVYDVTSVFTMPY